jgi:flavodoxin I
MKTLVVYDSVNGNTEQIAKAIAQAISGADFKRASEVQRENMAKLGFLIVGAPTQGGKPSPVMLDFLGKMPAGTFEGVKVAAFDTRMTMKFVKLFGYAAGKIADELTKKGGTLAAQPEGFFVKGAKGPLVDGEVERAAVWAKEIIQYKQVSQQ